MKLLLAFCLFNSTYNIVIKLTLFNLNTLLRPRGASPIHVYLSSMYRRPNAPFKPPRPIGVTEVKKTEEPSLFVSEATDIVPPPLPKRPKRAPRPAIETPRVALHPSTSQAVNRKPNYGPTLTSSPSLQTSVSPQNSSKYYLVQWRKRSNKKNKSWEGDGYIVVSEQDMLLKAQQPDMSYRIIARSKKPNTEGIISIGVYEAEIECETTRSQVRERPEESELIPSILLPPSLQFKSPAINRSRLSNTSTQEAYTLDDATLINEVTIGKDDTTEHASSESEESGETSCVVPALSKFNHALNAPLVLPPIPSHPEVEVRVDERLTKVLRTHQREGVVFLYLCLMGFRNPGYHGALLADEMGLGKTLLTITLIWTLLKQSPIPTEKAAVKKVLICCPVSLIDNWRKEFVKWLDVNRIGVLALNGRNQSAAKDKNDIINFGKTRVYQVLIMSYEKVVSCSAELNSVDIDLLVCDEGHRLKSASNKVLKVLNGLGTEKRLLLTGTPIQNDLEEFYNILNFINPGILGTIQEFKRQYIQPIVKARDVNCHDQATRRNGKAMSTKLIEVSKNFIIRRTKVVIEDFLTDKTDILLFCKPSKLQVQLFKHIFNNFDISKVMNLGSRDVLSMINLCRKVCNSPSLLADDSLYSSIFKTGSYIPQELQPSALLTRTTGSKINVAVPLLLEFREAKENVVLVSNFTQTLDLLEIILSKLNFKFFRLDGQTPLNSREFIVSSFNKSTSHAVFLLSAKAGGVGLNLIGASRLILFDNDWNPLVDFQAMARIHRDGQQKPVFIYRLFTTGAIDEKIFQRQLMKNNLSDMFLDDNLESSLNVFEFEDLKDLFTITDTNCNTHDLIDCVCLGTGDDPMDQTEAVELTQEDSVASDEDSLLASSGWMSASEFKELDKLTSTKKHSIRSALSHYRHFDPANFGESIDLGDSLLAGLVPKLEDNLSYIFVHRKVQQV